MFCVCDCGLGVVVFEWLCVCYVCDVRLVVCVAVLVLCASLCGLCEMWFTCVVSNYVL